MKTDSVMTLRPADLIMGEDGEPRILDTHLATLLGYAAPRQIRRLIKRNMEPLQVLGIIVPRGTMIEMGKGAQRETTEYLLTKQQALYLTAKSQTARPNTAPVCGAVSKCCPWGHTTACAAPAAPSRRGPKPCRRSPPSPYPSASLGPGQSSTWVRM